MEKIKTTKKENIIGHKEKITKVIVMIPAYNEEATIGKVIRDIKEIGRNDFNKIEVLVVNDGSTDNTIRVSKEAEADHLFSHKNNLGLGMTFKDGINEALKHGADIIVNIDADGQFNPKDIPRLLQPILENKADMVTCSRFKDPALVPKMPGIKIFGNKFFARIINSFLNKSYTDTQCGFRAYSREAALHLTLFGKYTYTQEVFIDLVKKGFRIVEVPCAVIGERNGKSRVVSNIFSYGLKVSLILLRSMRDYEPLKFFGLSGFILFMMGLLSSLILFIRFLFVGKYDPYMSVIYINIFVIIVGFLFIVLGLIADMLDRNRQLQEEILYKMKKKECENKL